VLGGTNHEGGITAGISNGKDIWFKVAFKPTSSIGQRQETINKNNETVSMALEGRHDPCVVIRAVPIIEAIAYFTLLNSYLESKIESL
jgi:chorismate synthase